MTEFWKDGFWRISKYGVKHWVSGHSVSRDDWSRSGASGLDSAYWWDLLVRLGVANSAAASFVNPNAECPVCGAQVFFYQNEYGSRVFFDDLGPPWPKHPCTIASPSASHTSSSQEQISPTPRNFPEVAQINIWSSMAGLDSKRYFLEKYGNRPWDAWRLERKLRAGRKTLAILSSAGSDIERKLFLSIPRVPRCLDHGSIVFYRRGRLAYFDHNSMGPGEIVASRVRSSSAFIDALLAKADEESGSP
jgi:hypothetical protein